MKQNTTNRNDKSDKKQSAGQRAAKLLLKPVQRLFIKIANISAASESLVAQGVLDDADKQARLAVRTMLQGLGFENITVR